jgi:hypothetical protein
MNCDVVRIFRKHGFAWGGNWRTPDGMHFEWVGERRDQLTYPSRFCPNVAGGSPQSNDPNGPAAPEIGLEVLISALDASSEA